MLLITFLIFTICSWIFTAIVLQRLFSRMRELKLPESRRTLLFGFFNLRKTILAYILSIIFYTVIMLIFTLSSP